MRETIPPTKDEKGDEHHPAFGLIGANRVQSNGTVLFDSDVKHHHFVTVRISTAVRTRKLKHDSLFPKERLIEVAMSEAQWASFVSSMNSGSGVACTIEARERGEVTPDMPYAPRLQESMDEVRSAGVEALEAVRKAFAEYKAHKTVGNLRHLEAMIANAPSNMEFAAKSLNEHAENVVQKARADIEAMVLAKSEQLGLDPGDVSLAELEEHVG